MKTFKYFSNKWKYRRGYRKLFGDEMLPDIQRALDIW